MAHFRYMSTVWHAVGRTTALAMVALTLAACGADGTPQSIHITAELKLPAEAALDKGVTAEVSLVQLSVDPAPISAETPASPDDAPVASQRIVAKQTLHGPDSMPVAFDLEVARAL